jgi:hypothetical protein
MLEANPNIDWDALHKNPEAYHLINKMKINKMKINKIKYDTLINIDDLVINNKYKIYFKDAPDEISLSCHNGLYVYMGEYLKSTTHSKLFISVNQKHNIELHILLNGSTGYHIPCNIGILTIIISYTSKSTYEIYERYSSGYILK